MSSPIRSLLAAWGALMALTLVLAFAGDVVHASRLGPVWIVLIALVAGAKARIVLGSYLGLSAAPHALLGFTGAQVVALAVVVASFLIFKTPEHRLSPENSAASLNISGLTSPICLSSNKQRVHGWGALDFR